jgi:prepilin-type N-terminal cleavage/methylation domain-containing protein
MRSPNTRGFTLIELLIVVVIIGVLAAIALPRISSTKQRANRSSGLADMRNLATGQEKFFVDNSRYGGLADTAAMPFTPSTGNTGLVINLTGTPAGATGYNASISIQGNETCGVYYGAAPKPTGMPLSTPDGAPACW